MAQIAGVTFIKSTSGRVTHVKLSKKYFAKLIEDLEDSAAMNKARKGETVPWEAAKKSLLQTAKRNAGK